uniref:Uncharacterized protein n=1 Tax=Setaria viridis TaxID=4556 RepID=A0A4U6STP4_SETVI|nr:hypothetical protein SEVIR_9G113950v2 [Setaria viridis]
MVSTILSPKRRDGGGFELNWVLLGLGPGVLTASKEPSGTVKLSLLRESELSSELANFWRFWNWITSRCCQWLKKTRTASKVLWPGVSFSWLWNLASIYASILTSIKKNHTDLVAHIN